MSDLQSFSAWKSGLEAMGYRVEKTSSQGSVLFSCDGKPSYRVSSWEPNEATAYWMRRTGCVDARCEMDEEAACDRRTDLPEFGPTEPQYRIIDCIQGSEEWDKLRARPTASNFSRIVTPVNGDYCTGKSSSDYAAEIVAKRMGVYVESPPSFWMTWGTENEPHALATYEQMNGVSVRKVGFIVPNFTDVYGGSPDGLVGNDGMIEIKCPKPETVIRYHADGVLPDDYRPQIQGLLLISRLPWCDFLAWHPELEPFQIRVRADDAYQSKIATAIYKLLEEVERLESCVGRQHNMTMTNEQAIEQEYEHYESADITI